MTIRLLSGSAASSAIALVARCKNVALDLVFPPTCAYCRALLAGGNQVQLCEGCLAAFSDRRRACPRCAATAGASPALPCSDCQNRRLQFSAAVRLGSYDDALRLAVLRMKDRKDRALALALGDLLWERCRDQFVDWKIDAVVPVPMHWTRRLRRGVNSPTTIAQRIATHLHVPMAEHLLARRRRTVPQAPLSPRRRRANVRGAFRASAHRDLRGARLLVVDDIMTTGATLDEVAKALAHAGAEFVAVAVIARASTVH